MVRWQPQPKIRKQKLPSQPIILYRGFSELITLDNVIEGKSIVQTSWYPFPRITIKFIYYGEDRTKLDDIDLKLTELIPQSRLKVHFSGGTYYGTGKNELSGYLIEPFRKGNTEDLSSVTFYITNFYAFNISNEFDDFEDEEDTQVGVKVLEPKRESWLMFEGQYIFDYENWHIVLATLEDGYELEEKLNTQGGYGVNHICKIEHLDNQTFNLDEVYEVIDAFIYYLSFVRGFWIAPLLISGFDHEGNHLLEEWRTPTINADSWQSTGYSWTTEDSNDIVYAFSGFMKKWHDEIWHEVIKNAIQWYLEGNKHTNGYNTSIILVHSALEKLAWTYLNSNHLISSNGFQKLTFDDKVRLLIKILDIASLSES